MSKCNICNQEFDSEIKLSKHIQHTHKLKKTEYLIQTKYKGNHPLCGCGCGQKTRYEPSQLDFCRFIKGHQSRLEGHWGDLKSEKRVKAISQTRKNKFASGEYDYIKDSIKEARKDPKLGEKISKGAKGVAKPKPKGFGVGRKHSQETKNKMRDTAIENILKQGKVKRSQLEYRFETLLDLLEIKYTHSFYIPSIKKIYDFYLLDYNILIEIDGDFWHGNPTTNHHFKYVEQTKINDLFKENLAKEKGYTLIRFWEKDIKENPMIVIDFIKNII